MSECRAYDPTCDLRGIAARARLRSGTQRRARPRRRGRSRFPPLARWIDLQNATLNTRYRFIDSSEGLITTNQLQHRETLRARLKFDAPGRYALNFGVSTGFDSPAGGTTRASGWATGRTRSRSGSCTSQLNPSPESKGSTGACTSSKGESTEITTYDDDGYVIGERVSVRRPRQFFFDEMSATVGYFSSAPEEIGVSKRVKYLNDHPNYGHFLVDKKLGTRGGVSADFTSAGRGANLASRDERQYERTARSRLDSLRELQAHERQPGLWVCGDGHQGGHSRKSASTGAMPASISSTAASTPTVFTSGNRVFVMATYVISPRFTASAFITQGGRQRFPLFRRER